MKFEFDTTHDGPQEAAALATALVILHGQAVVDALDKAEGSFEPRTSMVVNNTVTAPKAADGYTEEPSAADAFGDLGPASPNLPQAPDEVLDSAGIPWDERIHSSTKGTNKDGSWSRRRNTPDEVFDKVMAELKGEAAPVPPASPAPPAPAPIINPETGAELIGMPASPVGAPVTFPQLMVKITKAQGQKRPDGTPLIDKATVDGFLSSFGLTTMAQVASSGADTIAAINAMVDEHVANT